MVKDHHNDDIDKAWEKIKTEKNKDRDFEIVYNFETIYKRGAFAQDTLYEGGILFLGIAASYDEESGKKAIKPKIIVVNNALVRRVIKDNDFKINHELKYFPNEKTIEYGTPVLLEPTELKDVPIFFTSMLSGQRALDTGSYERLEWHINWLRKNSRLR